MLKWESDLLAIISTHTLTWSVTEMFSYFVNKFGISTHTLTWSVTEDFDFTLNKLKDFNSHAHVERDLVIIQPGNMRINFNSHAHVERDT